MLTCYAVRHESENQTNQIADHTLLQAIADEASIQFEPGWVEISYLEMPPSEAVRQAVEERLREHRMSYDVVTRIAY